MTACPTPDKSRFATREAAERAAERAQVPLGVWLWPYDNCACGWVHLTSTDPLEVPADAVPDPVVVNRLRWLPDAEFRALVEQDTTSVLEMDQRIALRHPRLRGRWRRALRDLLADIDHKLADSAGDPACADWRQRARGYRDVLTIRAREAGALQQAA